MSDIVLDASAILAIIHGEPGADRLTATLLARAVCSTVNLAEVTAKLVSRGWSEAEAWEDATSPLRASIPFADEHAKVSAGLVQLTRPIGLSLGDRACLALGLSLGAPVYTTNKLWTKLKLPIRVHVIR
jgi:PIN domain nuclease of toxin-antitoxin system